MLPAEPQGRALATQVQQALALVRGPFLDGFWLGEEAPFDEWIQQQQQQWQVGLHLLFERLSAFQESGGGVGAGPPPPPPVAVAARGLWEAEWRPLRVAPALGETPRRPCMGVNLP